MSDPVHDKIIKFLKDLGYSGLEANRILEDTGATERTPTTRALFAGMAMQGILSGGTKLNYLDVVKLAVQHSDALAAELLKEKK